MREDQTMQKNNRIIREQLRSEEGASLALALLFFVLCAVVGSVILTAASAAVGRMSHISDNRQANYALSEARKILREELGGSTFMAVGDADGAVPNGTLTEEKPSIDSLEKLQTTLGQMLLENQWNDIRSRDLTDANQENANLITLNRGKEAGLLGRTGDQYPSVEIAPGGSDLNLPTVKASVQIDTNGDLLISMVASGGRDVSRGAAAEFVIPAQPVTIQYDEVASEAEKEQKTEITYTLTWEKTSRAE